MYLYRCSALRSLNEQAYLPRVVQEHDDSPHLQYKRLRVVYVKIKFSVNFDRPVTSITDGHVRQCFSVVHSVGWPPDIEFRPSCFSELRKGRRKEGHPHVPKINSFVSLVYWVYNSKTSKCCFEVCDRVPMKMAEVQNTRKCSEAMINREKLYRFQSNPYFLRLQSVSASP